MSKVADYMGVMSVAVKEIRHYAERPREPLEFGE